MGGVGGGGGGGWGWGGGGWGVGGGANFGAYTDPSFQSNLKRNSNVLIQENAFENVI